MDWLAKILSLPQCFLSSGPGGGMLQGTTSEAIVTVMVAAQERYLEMETADLQGSEKERVMAEKNSRLVALGGT